VQLDKGFVYFWFLQDTILREKPGSPASQLARRLLMEGLAAMSLSKGGAMEAAKALWLPIQESPRVDIKQNAEIIF
jgi:hypothetical protein